MLGAAFLIGAMLSPAVLGTSLAAAATPTVTFSIDTTASRLPISPLIYGLNDSANTNSANFSTDLSSVRPTLIRQGGNRFTAYNWETNASNAGNDWCFENDDYLSSSTTPGAAVLPTIQQAKTAGAASLVTVPIVGYLANDTNGGTCTLTDERNSPANIMNTPNYVATRLVPNNPVDPAPLSTTPNLTDHKVYQDQFVYSLKQSVAPNAKVLFSLDNEPDFWPCTHAEVLPPPTIPASGACTDPYNRSQSVQTGQGAGFVAFVNQSLAYARAIKNVWPTAVVTGPALGGYAGFLQFQGTSPSDMTNFGEFADYYLRQVHAANASAGKTLIDDFDFHWYPQNGVDDADKSPAIAAVREQTPRSLWDPTYLENSWITQCCSPNNGPIDLLPWLQGKIDADNPGMKMAVTEWRYGAGNDISGGIADADALGLFGRYGIHAATYWPDGDGTSFAHGAFELYRNYDGHGASFGDTEVKATSSETCRASVPCYTSVYASTQSNDPSTAVIVAVNKNTVAESASVNLKGFNSAQASVFTLTSSSPSPKPAPAINATTTSNFTYLLPAQSVSVIVPKLAQVGPAFTAETPPRSSVAGFPYSYTFKASGIPSPTYSIGSGTLPAGLNLDATTGVLAGRPVATGSSTFTVKAHNSTPPDATTASITIGVIAQAAPHFTADSPPGSATTTVRYSYMFHATGSPAPIYAIRSGAAPPGVRLNASNGLLSGAPTGVGRFTFTVQASNGVAPVATSPPLVVNVTAPPRGAVFDSG